MSNSRQVSAVPIPPKDITVFIEKIEDRAGPAFCCGHVDPGDDVGFTSDIGFGGEVSFGDNSPFDQEPIPLDGQSSALLTVKEKEKIRGHFPFTFKGDEQPLERHHRLCVDSAGSGLLRGNLRFYFKRDHTVMGIDYENFGGVKSVSIRNDYGDWVNFKVNYFSMPIWLGKGSTIRIDTEGLCVLSLSELMGEGPLQPGGTTGVDIFCRPWCDPRDPKPSR